MSGAYEPSSSGTIATRLPRCFWITYGSASCATQLTDAAPALPARPKRRAAGTPLPRPTRRAAREQRRRARCTRPRRVRSARAHRGNAPAYLSSARGPDFGASRRVRRGLVAREAPISGPLGGCGVALRSRAAGAVERLAVRRGEGARLVFRRRTQRSRRTSPKGAVGRSLAAPPVLLGRVVASDRRPLVAERGVEACSPAEAEHALRQAVGRPPAEPRRCERRGVAGELALIRTAENELVRPMPAHPIRARDLVAVEPGVDRLRDPDDRHRDGVAVLEADLERYRGIERGRARDQDRTSLDNTVRADVSADREHRPEVEASVRVAAPAAALDRQTEAARLRRRDPEIDAGRQSDLTRVRRDDAGSESPRGALLEVFE